MTITALDQAIADIVAAQISAAEKRILAQIGTAQNKTLTFREARDYLQMSDYTLRSYCKQKRIPHRVIGAEGSSKPRYLFSSSLLDQWTRDEESKNCVQ